ncbi:MAG: electron transfer flavoprotein subunit alpha/FixB family protein [Alphaproteobacteria bacterium]|nr:electron transfer flavoprotein subunit alpha/FixB family protein [Alphaproteobacteria bacterium]
MSTLVIAEHDNVTLAPATLNCLTAAQKIGGDIDFLVAANDGGSVAEEAAMAAGVRKVLKADSPAYEHPVAENLAPLIARLASEYTHILAPATTFGKNILPRAAGLLDVQMISDVTAIVAPDTFERPIYAGNAIATVRSKDARILLTIRSTAFDPAAAGGGNAVIENIDATSDAGLSRFVKAELSESDRPELGTAGIVVSGGRGVGSAENFSLIEQLADRLGAAVGASRAAVDAGFVPNDYQVGQTGKIVAPELYIAIGISGAIQHLAGMKDSKVIVAINKDEEAPIFEVADYGLVEDLFKAVPDILEKL